MAGPSGPAFLFNFYPRSPCGERRGHDFRGRICQGFLSTLSLRRATVYALKLADLVLFLSTLSLRRATDIRPENLSSMSISIHALLAESDNLRVVDGSKSSIISIHALLAESDSYNAYLAENESISIHALLAESDKPSIQVQHLPKSISIHALLAESDCECWTAPNLLSRFLSTLSLRRATMSWLARLA